MKHITESLSGSFCTPGAHKHIMPEHRQPDNLLKSLFRWFMGGNFDAKAPHATHTCPYGECGKENCCEYVCVCRRCRKKVALKLRERWKTNGQPGRACIRLLSQLINVDAHIKEMKKMHGNFIKCGTLAVECMEPFDCRSADSVQTFRCRYPASLRIMIKLKARFVWWSRRPNVTKSIYSRFDERLHRRATPFVRYLYVKNAFSASYALWNFIKISFMIMHCMRFIAILGLGVFCEIKVKVYGR